MGRVKRICYLSPRRAAKVQVSPRIRAVSPEPPLLADTSSESKGTVRQKTRSLAPLNGWACAFKICHDGMFEDTNSLDGAHMSDNMFQPFNDVIVKTCYFDMQSCERVKKTFMLPQNDNSGGSKHIIPELGQKSNEGKH